MKRTISKPTKSSSPWTKRKSVDNSDLLQIPTLSQKLPLGEPPKMLKIKLFNYQLRSLYQMEQVELIKTFTLHGISKELTTKGGVIADCVGLGKTALCIALIAKSKEQGHNSKTLVITPSHLSRQWFDEIQKFVGDDGLKCLIIDFHNYNRHISLDPKFQKADVVITTLEFITSFEYLGLDSALHKIPWKRVIFDECHEVILIKGTSMTDFQKFTTDHVWCVSGTPFTHGDKSIYGINQLLGIQLKLNVTNNPFAICQMKNKNSAFEELKAKLYLRNTPKSILQGIRKSKNPDPSDINLLTLLEPSFIEKIIYCDFTPIEQGFYDECHRRILPFPNNLYSSKLLTLRQLCSHPGVNERWVLSYRGIDQSSASISISSLNNMGKSLSSNDNQVASLKDLGQMMLLNKEKNINEQDTQIQSLKENIIAAKNGNLYLTQKLESNQFYQKDSKLSNFLVVANANSLKQDMQTVSSSIAIQNADFDDTPLSQFQPDNQGRIRIRVLSVDKAMGFFDMIRQKKDLAHISSITIQELESMMELNSNWMKELHNKIKLCYQEIENSRSEIKFFKSQVAKFTMDDENGDQEGSNQDNASSSERYDQGLDCIICSEIINVGAMMVCGHSTCAPCLDRWLQKHSQCPTCRGKVDKDKDVSKFHTKKAMDNPLFKELLESDLILYKKETRTHIPTLVSQLGSKPAAIVVFLQTLFKRKPDSRVIIFSQWDSMLQLMSRSLKTSGLKHMFSKRRRNLIEGGFTPDVAVENDDEHIVMNERLLNPYLYYGTRPIFHFAKSSDFRILMLSMLENASGTNLQCADHILFLETACGDNQSHAMSTEQQAIGRAVRIGQSKTVNVIRFIMKDTVEEELYELQEMEKKKRQHRLYQDDKEKVEIVCHEKYTIPLAVNQEKSLCLGPEKLVWKASEQEEIQNETASDDEDENAQFGTQSSSGHEINKENLPKKEEEIGSSSKFVSNAGSVNVKGARRSEAMPIVAVKYEKESSVSSRDSKRIKLTTIKTSSQKMVKSEPLKTNKISQQTQPQCTKQQPPPSSCEEKCPICFVFKFDGLSNEKINEHIDKCL